MFFLQMAGFPGSGKSTLARAIAKETKAIIIDHDIVKSALLEASDTDVDHFYAGKVSYSIEWAMLDFHLSQGHSVILDSPCFYIEMLEKGMSLSQKHNVKYKYVECYLNDIQETNNRLKNRKRKASQIEQVASEAQYQFGVHNSKKPEYIPCLTVDSRKPLSTYINQVLDYLSQ